MSHDDGETGLLLSPESNRESRGPSPKSWGALTQVELRLREVESRVTSSPRLVNHLRVG